MSKSSKPYVNDIGTVILLNTGYDLTTATLLQIYVKKPFGTVEIWTGTMHSDSKSIAFSTLGSGNNAYQELGMNIIESDESGLEPNKLYNLSINDINYEYITGVITTYEQIIIDLNLLLTDITVSVVLGDIRFTHNVNSYKNNINLSKSSYNCFFTSLTGFVDFEDSIPAIVSSFDREGVYNLQAYIETPLFKGRGETVELEVYGDFK